MIRLFVQYLRGDEIKESALRELQDKYTLDVSEELEGELEQICLLAANPMRAHLVYPVGLLSPPGRLLHG